MTGSKITLTDTATAVVSRVIGAARHPGELMATFAALMLTSTQRRFERQVGPDGVAWKPLSKRTANARIGRRRRGTSNILRVTTRLYRSLTTASDATSAEVGTNVEYAGVHQFGAEIPHYARSTKLSLKKVRNRYRFVRPGTKGAVEKRVTIGEHVTRIPARPYLGFNDQDVAAMTAAGQDFLKQEMAE